MQGDLEASKIFKSVVSDKPDQVIHNQALDATNEEHALSMWQAIRLYPKSIAWSAYFALGIIMVAFDPQLIGQLIATDAFQKQFGIKYGDEYLIPAPWQTALNMGAPIGQILGAFFAGTFMEWIGRKKAFGICNIVIVGSVFIQFFSESLAVLMVGEILAGLILGCFVTIAPAYASETVPLAARSAVMASINLCFAIGQLIANGTVDATQTLETHWAYRIPFSIQWLWPLIIFIGYPFVPESPWWLQRQGRLEDAEKALAQLSSSKVDVKPALAAIIETDRLEQAMEMGSTYLDCFKGSNFRRTTIAVGVMSIQVFSGIYLSTYATYFFEVAGLASSQAFNLGVGFIAVGLVGTLLSWFALSYLGRRTIFNCGLAVLAVLQLIIGGIDCTPGYNSHSDIAMTESVLMVIWYFFYSLSIGPVGYVYLCEISAIRVRGKTIAIALAVEALATILMAVAFPYMINPDEANMRGKVGFVFGGLALLLLLWSWLNLPELKGRTVHELDLMFSNGIKSRNFKRTVISDSMPVEVEEKEARKE